MLTVLVFWSWVLLLPRLPPWSRNILLYRPLDSLLRSAACSCPNNRATTRAHITRFTAQGGTRREAQDCYKHMCTNANVLYRALPSCMHACIDPAGTCNSKSTNPINSYIKPAMGFCCHLSSQACKGRNKEPFNFLEMNMQERDLCPKRSYFMRECRRNKDSNHFSLSSWGIPCDSFDIYRHTEPQLRQAEQRCKNGLQVRLAGQRIGDHDLRHTGCF